MSRIGKLPIAIPAGVTVTLKDDVVTVKGPKGELSQYVNPLITVTIDEKEVLVSRSSDEKQERSMHGLYRALINNMVVGVSEGYKKELELVGVGYRVSNTGNVMELALGFTIYPSAAEYGLLGVRFCRRSANEQACWPAVFGNYYYG